MVFALPLIAGLLIGLLFPLVLIADRIAPGVASGLLDRVWMAPETISGTYLAAQAVPVFALALLAVIVMTVLFARDRRRIPEAFESLLDARPGLHRLRRGLWEIARGAALSGGPPSAAELGRRYAALLSENLGEPGFRELVLRTADLDRGEALTFALLGPNGDPHEGSSMARETGLDDAIDLRASGQSELLFDAVATGLLCPMAMPLRRVSFPKGGGPRRRDPPADRRHLRSRNRHRRGPRRRGGAGDRGDRRPRDRRAPGPAPGTPGPDRRRGARVGAPGGAGAGSRRSGSTGS